jgi:hypothetical protein
VSLEHKHAILDALMAVMDEEHARALIEYRRVTIKMPLTEYGAKRLAAKLSAWGDANEAADIMIDRLWRGFEPSWVKDRRRPNSILQAGMNLIGEMNGAAGRPSDHHPFALLPPAARH